MTTKVQLTFPTQTMVDAIESFQSSVVEDYPELLTELNGIERPVLTEEVEEIMDMAITILSKHLSEEEILFLNELYSNPIILGIMKKYPAILKDAFELGKVMAAEKLAVYEEVNPF